MTDELAEKLRDAGFPQEDKTFYRIVLTEHKGEPIYDYAHNNPDWAPEEDDLALPTLSELIYECGDSLAGLQHWKNGKTLDHWLATGIVGPVDSMSREIKGDTPEEAVANFWLKKEEEKVV